MKVPAMRYSPLSDTVGAELLDFDATRPASPDEQAELRSLLCEHHVLVVRGQALSEDDQDRFTEYFGPASLMFNGGTAGYISNRPRAQWKKGEYIITGQKELLWHTDGTQGEHPGMGNTILAIEAGPGCAPTKFINTVRIAANLPAELRARITGREAMHRRENVYTTDQRMCDRGVEGAVSDEQFQSIAHPILFRLPHSDKEALFVNELSTSHIVGLPVAESKALLEELFAEIYRDELVYSHYWQTGDLLIWDNMALQHCRATGPAICAGCRSMAGTPAMGRWTGTRRERFATRSGSAFPTA
jgi:taurine dioxygenase